MKKFLLFVIMTVLAITSVACGKKETQKASAGKGEGDRLVTNIGSDPYTLDSAIATDSTSGYVIGHLFSSLYTQDSDGKYQNELAEKEEVNADGTEYTIHLKKDIKWSDGSAITANDFEFAWKRLLNPKTGSMNATEMYFIKGAEAYNTGKGEEGQVGIQVVDPQTLKVTLEHPVASIKQKLASSLFIPLAKKSIDDNNKLKTDPKELITNGPFTLKEWKHNQAITVQKNKEYYDKKVTLKEIEFRIIPDSKTAYQLYKSKELDLLSGLPQEMIEKEKGNKEYKRVAGFSSYIYSFNVEKEPFTNAKVRKAFSLAVDRKFIVEKLYKNNAQEANAFVPEGAKTQSGRDFRKEKGGYVKFDPAEAKKLLEEGMKEQGWSTLPEVTLKFTTDTQHKKVAEAMQEMFKKNLGVDIKLENKEWKSYIDTYKQSDFQLAYMGWGGSLLDPITKLDLYAGDGPNNYAKWHNKEFDALVKEAEVEQNEDKRFDLLHKAEDIMFTDSPLIPIIFPSDSYLQKQTVSGLQYYVGSKPDLRYAKIKK
ncbi:peptide ABC transporter substrate-binding protein [Bacillus thuringiensis]|uniref:Peptide ABC transporter substrate-binding protein n=7 Tax=Bacillus cereus group TaxID=86661 RepID=A0A9X6XQX6_BACTU|nr:MULTISPECIES: peptide ABC transporter substrate-binding protein [Bacillus]MED1155630.1 peptide ABC transporter substrate-binding protein [Bacillus paranthracis]ACK93206.1 oligopeptide ABC transporter, oligopeptide-binding protein [Bacillus cereus G9842]AFQ29548.1 oligopeptide ABC transporter substrate-binding protein [Bacillus thuringiensis HD-789]AJH06683.1 bacterial extracellular solute-binding s, 5 Middle family protein [Bacillus thuringiensis HD1002]AJQ56967.1 peptide ABC transporter su